MRLTPPMPSASRGVDHGRGHGRSGLHAPPPLLLGVSALALLIPLQGGTAHADNCAVQRQVCESTGGHLCGFDVGATGCLYQCCTSKQNVCCGPTDQNGLPFAECCGITPDYTGACQLDCKETCNRPCGVGCCRISMDEVCVNPSIAECCPSQDACGLGTASAACCKAPEVCTPEGTCCLPGQVGCRGQCCAAGLVCDGAGTCCPAAQLCGGDCCPTRNCCNGQCCAVGFSCQGNRVCCDGARRVCGDTCCATNKRCFKHKRKPPVCKCKKKGKKCGGTRCCVGDQCIDGDCVSPLPRGAGG